MFFNKKRTYCALYKHAETGHVSDFVNPEIIGSDQIKLRLQDKETLETRKRFSEKPIVAFTNSRVFILDFYILLSLWSPVLGLSAWTLKKAHIVSCQEASEQITNICMQKFLTNWTLPPKTIPDCIRYIIGVFCYNFKSQY